MMVSAAIGDNQASYVGSVAKPNEAIHINIGTGAQISYTLENSPDQNESRIEIRPFTQNLSLATGSSLCGCRRFPRGAVGEPHVYPVLIQYPKIHVTACNFL